MVILLLALCFGIAAALLVALVVVSILYVEERKRLLGYPLRKWRISLARRQAAQRAEGRATRAEANAVAQHHHALRTQKWAQQQKQHADNRVAQMGSYIIAEQAGDHIKGIRASNYHAKLAKIQKSVEVAAKNGYILPADERELLDRMLKQAHEKAIRMERERERQAEIKAEIREEERRQKEFDRAVREAEREERIKRKALEDAIAMLGDTHSEQVEQLRRDLAEAQAKAERTKSMAQQTRVGHVYVLSNIGSFGRGVYKVGMTRRLDPTLRVRELGDASVPFPFDVHAMFSSDDAPALEAALHRELADYRVNRVNLRKEYFRVTLDQIVAAVRRHHGEIDYEIDSEAAEYFESEALAEEIDEAPGTPELPTVYSATGTPS